MVYKRKSNRRPKRKLRKKKAPSKRYTVKIKASLGPVAPRSICSMRYNALFQSTIAGDQVFNLNSTFDPDLTGIGHQPYGRDTYATLYNRYRVFAVSGSVATTTTSGTGIVSIVATNSSTPLTSQTLIAEMPNSRKNVVCNGQVKVIKFKYSLPRVNGSTSTAYKSDDRFQALANANPAEIICLHVLSTDSLGTSTTTIFNDITLNYHVEWFDPAPLVQS